MQDLKLRHSLLVARRVAVLALRRLSTTAYSCGNYREQACQESQSCCKFTEYLELAAVGNVCSTPDCVWAGSVQHDRGTILQRPTRHVPRQCMKEARALQIGLITALAPTWCTLWLPALCLHASNLLHIPCPHTCWQL